jgi:hypothetical protein
MFCRISCGKPGTTLGSSPRASFAGKCSKRFYILSHFLRQTGNHFAGKCSELLITFEMFAQLVDRAKSHGPLSQMRLDRTIGVECVGHAINHAGL